MSDVEYSVSVRYLSEGNLYAGLAAMQGATTGLTGKVRDLEKGMGGIGNSLASSLGGAVESISSTLYDGVVGAAKLTGAAAAGAIGLALKEGIKFSDYIEQSTIGIASVRTMLGGEQFDSAERAAAASVERMRVFAKDLPGEMKDVVNAFSYIQPATIGLGIKDTRAESLSAHGVAAAAAIGVGQATFGRELAAMIEGRARSAMPAVAKLGFHAKELNAMDPIKRFNLIEERINKLGPAIERYKTSWAGLTSAGVDSAKQVARVFASPVFESLKTEMGRGLEWFGKNEDAVNAFATSLGVRVDYAFHRGVDAVKHWFPIVRTFGEHLYESIVVPFERMTPYLDRFAARAEKFMLDPDAGSKLANGAAILGGARLGVSAASMFGPALGLELGPALAVAAPLVIAAAGAFDVLSDSTNYWHDTAMKAADDIRVRAGVTGDHLASSFDRLAPTGKRLADLLGVTMVAHLDGLVFGLEKAASWFDIVTGALSKGIGDLEADVNRFTGLTAPWRTLNKDPQTIDPMRAPFEIMSLHSTNSTIDEVAKAMQIKQPPQHNVHVHGGIHIKVEGNGDPARVAVKVEDILRRKLLAPSAARSNPNAMFSR